LQPLLAYPHHRQGVVCLTDAQYPGRVEARESDVPAPALASGIAVVDEPKLLNLQERRAVPLARYFIFVGGALLALLLIVGWCLPRPPAMFADQLTIDRTIIRIKSARKWPEKVVLDTSQQIVTPPVIEEAPAARPFRLSYDRVENRSDFEAMAQLKPDAQLAAVENAARRVERGSAKTARSARRITHRVARTEAGGSCCQFGWEE
jgi:hypothetical protein